VTFLFTDVEGSTKLLHELGAEAYADPQRAPALQTFAATSESVSGNAAESRR
jgi:hypothetical protein